MIDPPGTSSPAKRLTPSLWAFESRPLRELPPAFLCAIALSSARDLVDLDGGESLPVSATAAAGVLPAPEAEDDQLLAAAVLDHRPGDRRALHERRAHRDAVPLAHGEDLVE